MILPYLLDQAERLGIGIALVVTVLGALYLWQQAVKNVGPNNMLRNFNLRQSQEIGGADYPDGKNDIYSTFEGDVSRNVKPYKINLIYPATERHVLKHTDQSYHMVVETKEAYRMITKAYIESIPADNVEWVYNILDHKSETERIVYEDSHPCTGFVLLPDFKWSDPSKLESLYCLAIVRDRSLRSLRDLSGSNLKLLRNIRNAGLEVLREKFGVNPSSIRMYLHYQPTYYHLHVHFSHVKMTQGTLVGKAVLLEDVIYNLSVNSDHYKNATLSFVIGELQHKQLFELYREKHII
ncbi:scavenger mrna-decapping enzyme [Plasmopara halstedii]|uniref:m7GpppX diphosphatase n=1 Tax=Plasmopara halstedii TaxID=4781 RepID=A0A0P1A6Q4_PLAHL|nr:scavenger mrna-decapping enzyme [Plasmopara halstedii]CEG35631.1 scavenger mrna-decapping enzyme [Plasmopara halstedii]|eukprot:XP_024572000.1 scavenger mrna-decapping enzyme [Plasmopara halstedii]